MHTCLKCFGETTGLCNIFAKKQEKKQRKPIMSVQDLRFFAFKQKFFSTERFT